MALFLWYFPFWLLALLVWVMLRRRAYQVSPWFFGYVTFGVVADLARFATHSYPHSYFVTYWITEAIFCILGILTMYEVMRSALGNLPCAWWVHLIFPSILFASAGLGLSRTHSGPQRVAGILLWIVTGEIATRIVQVVVFAGLATLIPFIGLRWRRHSFGVAMGFGFYATVELLTSSKLADLGTDFVFLWGVISVAAYSAAVLIWIWFSWIRAKVTEPDLDLTPALH